METTAFGLLKREISVLVQEKQSYRERSFGRECWGPCSALGVMAVYLKGRSNPAGPGLGMDSTGAVFGGYIASTTMTPQ